MNFVFSKNETETEHTRNKYTHGTKGEL